MSNLTTRTFSTLTSFRVYKLQCAILNVLQSVSILRIFKFTTFNFYDNNLTFKRQNNDLQYDKRSFMGVSQLTKYQKKQKKE